MENRFFTNEEYRLLEEYHKNPDGLYRYEYEQLANAFERYCNYPPANTSSSKVSEAKHLLAILRGRLRGIDTSTELRAVMDI